MQYSPPRSCDQPLRTHLGSLKGVGGAFTICTNQGPPFHVAILTTHHQHVCSHTKSAMQRALQTCTSDMHSDLKISILALGLADDNHQDELHSTNLCNCLLVHISCTSPKSQARAEERLSVHGVSSCSDSRFHMVPHRLRPFLQGLLNP